MKVYDTIIVGGGPSGMTAALWCAREGQRVLLLDRCDRIGKKILVTGNGKCNLTNMYQQPECYRGESPSSIASILSSFDLKDTFALFSDLGLCTREKNGYIYPYNEQATAVREAFEKYLRSRKDLTIMTEMSVTQIQKEQDGFMVCTESAMAAGSKASSHRPDYQVKDDSRRKKQKTKKRIASRSFGCRSLIIACGGLAGVKLGCDGSGYRLAKALGHHVIPPFPALTALKSSAPFLKKLSGVRNQAGIHLLVNKKEMCWEQGELQWTDYGISGVAIFQISRFAILALEEKKEVQLLLDFMPEYSKQEVTKMLHAYQKNCEYKNLNEMLCGILPLKLVPVILKEASLEPDHLAVGVSEEVLQHLAAVIKQFPLRINGYMGYEKAQVTQGGIDMMELTEKLESCICPGLFFAGEILDVDGICGGYNLQWAFSSGSVAGKAAWERNGHIIL